MKLTDRIVGFLLAAAITFTAIESAVMMTGAEGAALTASAEREYSVILHEEERAEGIEEADAEQNQDTEEEIAVTV